MILLLEHRHIHRSSSQCCVVVHTAHSAKLHTQGEQLLWPVRAGGGHQERWSTTEMCTFLREQKHTHKHMPRLNNWPNVVYAYKDSYLAGEGRKIRCSRSA